MVFPIGDDNSDRTITPYVNYTLIAINLLVFIFLQGLGSNESFTYAFSAVPYEILNGEDITRPLRIDAYNIINHQPTPGPVYLTLLTSMFMHGGIAHIFGNMLYLWIFGDNLEDALGHVRYLAFYLVCGVLASLAHIFTSMSGLNSVIPSLGASGAIAGVLGGYILLFPRRRVQAIVLRGLITEIPAVLAIGIWILFQFIGGFTTAEGGGVAYGAHIGGFIAGLALIKLFAAGRERSNIPPAFRRAA